MNIRGEHEERTLAQIHRCAEDERAVAFALCADGHLGYNMPIGGVIAYKDAVSPDGVGFDIACGNKAVRLDVKAGDIAGDLKKLANAIWRSLSFGVGRINYEQVDHEVLDDPAWDEVPLLQDWSLRRKAREQLGTIGSGNHYVDVFRDENDNVWVGVHFGSRGLGHNIATEYINRAGGNPNSGMERHPCVLSLETETGQEYLEAMRLAGLYAYAGRDWVCEKVAKIIGAPIVEEVHNHHNFAWKETHFGEDVWVVRKGATPCAPGQRGFVGGSMGSVSYILEGVESPGNQQLLRSTVHGAGRVVSRTAAAGKSRWKGGRKIRISEGLVDMEKVRERLRNDGIILRGAGADEAPEVYRQLTDVVAAHGDTVKVIRTLHPLIVCMASEDEIDPYKD
jgi:tRNA-splicing ligase RtcB